MGPDKNDGLDTAWPSGQQQALNSGSSRFVQGGCHFLVVTHLPLALAVLQLDSESCVWNTTYKGRVLEWLLDHGVIDSKIRVSILLIQSIHSTPIFTECLSYAKHNCITFPKLSWY